MEKCSNERGLRDNGIGFFSSFSDLVCPLSEAPSNSALGRGVGPSNLCRVIALLVQNISIQEILTYLFSRPPSHASSVRTAFYEGWWSDLFCSRTTPYLLHSAQVSCFCKQKLIVSGGRAVACSYLNNGCRPNLVNSRLLTAVRLASFHFVLSTFDRYRLCIRCVCRESLQKFSSSSWVETIVKVLINRQTSSPRDHDEPIQKSSKWQMSSEAFSRSIRLARLPFHVDLFISLLSECPVLYRISHCASCISFTACSAVFHALMFLAMFRNLRLWAISFGKNVKLV